MYKVLISGIELWLGRNPHVNDPMIDWIMLYSNQHFLPSQPRFPPFYNWKTLFKSHFCWLLSTTIFILNDNRLNLSQTSPGFYVSAVQVFWKHSGKRRICLLRAISPFPAMFSICLKSFLPFSIKMKLSSANSFNLDESKIFLFGKELTHYQMTNFRLFQIERLFRRQFRIWRKWQKVIQTSTKHCGKRRNRSFRAISPFSTVFSKGLFPRGVKRCHCVGMG